MKRKQTPCGTAQELNFLKNIIASIDAGDGPLAWEALRVWYRRFWGFYARHPKFFGGRRKKCWDAIHSHGCVCEMRKEIGINLEEN